MTALTKEQAQQRVDDILAFQREAQRLHEAGLLPLESEQQQQIATSQQQILTQYAQEFDTDRNAGGKQLSLGMRITSLIGAVAFSAALMFLFHQFWGRFTTPLQIIILNVFTLASLGLTAWLLRADRFGYFCRLSAMLALTCFILNITMMGQIFNLRPSDTVLLVCSLYGLLLAYATHSRLLLAASLCCLATYVAARVGAWGGMYWLSMGERPENFFTAAILLFFMAWALRRWHDRGFANTYYVFGLLFLYLPLLTLSYWGESSYLPFSVRSIEYTYQILSFIVATLGIAWGVQRRQLAVMQTSLVFFSIYLFTKVYDWWWDFLPKYLFFLIMGGIAFAILWLLNRLRKTALQKGAL